jgi:hypothetical protein
VLTGGLIRVLIDIDGQEEKILEVLKEFPELLLKEPESNLVIESKFNNCRYTVKTPFAMLLKTKQGDAIKRIWPYLDKIENGHEKALKLLQDYKKENNQKKKENKAKKTLEMMNAIIDMMLANRGIEALDQFQKDILSPNAIWLKELDFEALLLAACQAYDTRLEEFHDHDQCDAFTIRVIGLLQYLQFPWIAKLLSTGLADVVNENMPIDEMENVLMLMIEDSFDDENPNEDDQIKDTEIWYYSPNGLGVKYYVNLAGDADKLANLEADTYELMKKLFDSRTKEFDDLVRKLIIKLIIKLQPDTPTQNDLSETLKIGKSN